MTYDETAKIFSVLKANYANFFKGVSRLDAEAMLKLWTKMFSDEPYEVVSAAVMSFIASDIKGFPPNVGLIKAHVRKLTKKPEMTEQEAANLILKAATNSIYNSKQEFEKLPPTLQRLVGSPNKLKEYALMDIEVLNTVVSSNIQRSFKIIQQQEKEYAALPTSIKQLSSALAENFKMIE